MIASVARTSKQRSLCAAVFGSLAIALAATSGWAAPPAAKLFSLREVKLLDGPLKHAQELDRLYLLQMEPDRLLAPIRTEAGLEPKAPSYKSWEDKGLGGQTAGHYLTAVAQMLVDTGDPELKRRLEYMVAELAECQKAGGDGWVGGVPNGKALWKEIAAGDIRRSRSASMDAGCRGTTCTSCSPGCATRTWWAATSRRKWCS